jgi:hypothetical protein
VEINFVSLWIGAHLLQRLDRVFAAHSGAAVKQLHAAASVCACDVRELERMLLNADSIGSRNTVVEMMKQVVVAVMMDSYLPSKVDVGAPTRLQAAAPGAVVDGHARSGSIFNYNIGEDQRLRLYKRSVHAVSYCAVEVENVAAGAKR